MLLVENKDFNALIDNKPIFAKPVKNKQEAHENVQNVKNDDYTTGNLLDFSYHQIYYKLIGRSLSRETNKNVSQQINFSEKLEENYGITMFFIAEKQQKLF